jgi:hypothetical protein
MLRLPFLSPEVCATGGETMYYGLGSVLLLVLIILLLIYLL